MSQIARHLVAHRGLWRHPQDRNSLESLTRASRQGFGVETDLRDWEGELVVSHDPPRRSPLDAVSCLGGVASESLPERVIALNIKSDGLLDRLSPIHKLLKGHDHFYFDMSTPELIRFMRSGLPVAMRLSEYETLNPRLVKLAHKPLRLWVDAIDSDWWLNDNPLSHIPDDSRLYLVSPELHGRNPQNVWSWFLESVKRGRNVFLCTDKPEEVSRMNQ